MKKIVYPDSSLYNFPDSYLGIFSLTDRIQMNTEYKALLSVEPSLSFLPKDIESVLLANYNQLHAWYKQYRDCGVSPAAQSTLGKVFNYDKWSDRIAEYFRTPATGFRVSTCYYCDTAFVNSYEIDPDDDAIYFMNAATDTELMRLTKSPVRIAEIKRRRPYHTKADFDKLASDMRWSANKYGKLFKPNYRYKHHFDLDHVLPKSKCPFVALSLFNFVPCCQVCNERLKKTKVLGLNGIPIEKLSPTSPLFDFDNNVSFSVTIVSGGKFKLRPTLAPDDYELKLTTLDQDYVYFVKLFKLEERYTYHKMIALDWLEKKIKYKDSRINMLADALQDPSFTFNSIKDDIFSEELYKNNDMVFSKLRWDILK